MSIVERNSGLYVFEKITYESILNKYKSYRVRDKEKMITKKADESQPFYISTY